MLLSERLSEIYDGPSGPSIGAFFDFDGTLIHGYSAVDFYLDRIRSGKVGPVEALRTTALALKGVETEEDFEELVKIGLSGLGGQTEDEVLEVGERVFAKRLAARIFPEGWQIVQAHKRMGHTVVLASSATRFQLEAAARTLGIDHVLSTAMESDDSGILTGRPDGPTLWRAGKSKAVREFGAAHSLDLPASYAYSNGTEDIDFLTQVGHPAATTPEDGLRAHALDAGWPVLDFRSRGIPGPKTVARSVAAMGGLLTGLGTGAAFGLLNRNRRTAISSMVALSAEYSLGLAGVKVETLGEEHLWSHRPAVFLFNHQSQLDVFVICHLLRRDFTGVAKQELMKDPVFGPVFKFIGVAFVDRKSGGDPRAQLAPAVEKLRSGVSVVIAPEGTRSLTPTLGDFKTGAFHLAREAGVPVIPIVIRNAGELMWRDSLTIKPGTVQVAVLPPIDVSAWPADEVRSRTLEVQKMFEDTLAHWPGEPAPAPAKPTKRPAKKAVAAKRTAPPAKRQAAPAAKKAASPAKKIPATKSVIKKAPAAPAKKAVAKSAIPPRKRSASVSSASRAVLKKQAPK